jgi:hypothetical protein
MNEPDSAVPGIRTTIAVVLLVSHGIRVRDFIMLSFLSDQGPMSVTQLSHAVSIDPEILSNGMAR